MASSQTPAASSSRAAQAAAFYDDFTRSATHIEQAIQQAKDADELTAPLSRISQMRTSVTENHDLLPAYDRNTYESKMKVLAGQVTSKRAELNKARGRFAFRRPVKPQPPAALSISETSSPSASVEGDQGAAAAQLEQNDTAIVREGRDSEQTAIASSSTLTPTPPISRSGFVWAGKKRARLHYRDILPVQREGAGESEGRGASDLHLTDLEHCFVDLRSSGPMKADNAKGDVSLELRAVQIRNVRSSIIFLADVRGSVMLHDCQGCIIVTRCRQYRMHDSKHCICLLTTDSAITLEGCRRLFLAPYPTDTAQHDGQPREPGNTPSLSLSEVQDFDHVSRLTASPNWEKASPEQIVGATGVIEAAHKSEDENWMDKLRELFNVDISDA